MSSSGFVIANQPRVQRGPPAGQQPQPNWREEITKLGNIAAGGEELRNAAAAAQANTRRLVETVGELTGLLERLNRGRLTAAQVLEATQAATADQNQQARAIADRLKTDPDPATVAEAIASANRVKQQVANEEQPDVGGAKKRRRRGGYKRSPTSGERRIASGSTRRKRASRAKRSKRSPTKKRTRTRTGGRRRR